MKIRAESRTRAGVKHLVTVPPKWGRLHWRARQGIVDAMLERYEEWDEDLTLIKAADRELSVAELNLRRRVAVARRHSHSWAAIGFILGISRQAAQQRFGTTGEASA